MNKWLLSIFVALIGCKSVDFGVKDPHVLAPHSKGKRRMMMISSSYIGCAPESIQIKDYYRLGMVTESWTAVCGEKVFFCAYAHTQARCAEGEQKAAAQLSQP